MVELAVESEQNKFVERVWSLTLNEVGRGPEVEQGLVPDKVVVEQAFDTDILAVERTLEPGRAVLVEVVRVAVDRHVEVGLYPLNSRRDHTRAHSAAGSIVHKELARDSECSNLQVNIVKTVFNFS